MQDPTKELATRLGAEITRFLWATLPKIHDRFAIGVKKSSVTLTLAFEDKDGEITCTITPKANLPYLPYVHKLQISEGQLSLFQGDEV